MVDLCAHFKKMGAIRPAGHSRYRACKNSRVDNTDSLQARKLGLLVEHSIARDTIR